MQAKGHSLPEATAASAWPQPAFSSPKALKSQLRAATRKTLDEAVAELGPDAHGYRADVTIAEDRKQLFAALARDFGNLDIVFANAGISGRTPTGATDEAIFEKVVHTNLNGAFFTVNSAAPLLNDNGSIIFNGSVHNYLGQAWRGCLRRHEGRTRLDGAVHRRRPCTTQDSRECGGPGGDEDSHLEARAARQCHCRGIRKARLTSSPPRFHLAVGAKPEDLAKAVLFLASDDSSYINAVELMVDGGLTGAPFGAPILRG